MPPLSPQPSAAGLKQEQTGRGWRSSTAGCTVSHAFVCKHTQQTHTTTQPVDVATPSIPLLLVHPPYLAKDTEVEKVHRQVRPVGVTEGVRHPLQSKQREGISGDRDRFKCSFEKSVHNCGNGYVSESRR